MTESLQERAFVGQQLQAARAWQPTDEDIENIAKLTHEANRVVCSLNGDWSQPTWEEAPDWQKDSARSGVRFHIATPHADGRASHDKWMEQKLREGWRYGETKDAEAKTHPCLLPYGSLPENQKIKDDIFKALVRAYAQAKTREANSAPASA